jgi:predicted nucleic acid-binding protein
MPFVLDASVTACWGFTDEADPVADLALLRIRSDDAFVPGLWWFEIRNILVINERRGRLTEAATAEFLDYLSGLRISVDATLAEAEILALARRHRLTVYDATYLHLAQRRGIPLATLDLELVRAARVEQVALIGD